jgi:hypothetical protein
VGPSLFNILQRAEMTTNSGHRQCFLETKDEHALPVQPSSLTKPSLLSRTTCDTWIEEFVSLLFGIICLVSIVAVLEVYNDNNLPNWPHTRDIPMHFHLAQLDTPELDPTIL